MLVTLPLVAFILLLLICRTHEPSWRGSALSAAVVWGLLLALMTEGLSLFHALTAEWVAALWASACLVLGSWYWSRLRSGYPLPVVKIERVPSSSGLFLGGVGLIVATTGFIALIAPPNTWDSMTYHMSRVMHWIQNQSVAHYPTHMLRQLIRSPWPEWAILHLQVLAHGDRFANTVQWFSMIGSVLGVSLLARLLGANPRTQIVAAAIASTIPMGILQASSTQTDYVVTFWLVCFVYFVLLLMKGNLRGCRFRWYSGGAGVSLGLAILSKATAYLYGFPFLLWSALAGLSGSWRKGIRSILLITGLALGMNLGHYARNLELFGLPLGPGGEEECTTCKLTNDAFTVPIFLSNALRNVGMHLGTPVESVNQAVEQGIYGLHSLIGADTRDPRSTWKGWPFHVRPPDRDENLDGNALHAVLIILCLALLLRPRELRSSPDLVRYTVCLVAAFLLFCWVLKWQPNHGRVHLALFVLWSPVIALALSTIRKPWVSRTFVLALIVASLPWVFLNIYRPLVGARTILNMDRDDLYFIHRPTLGDAFNGAVGFLTQIHCSQIGLIRGDDDWEYPFWVFMQRVATDVRIQHVSVKNESAILASREPFSSFTPCTIITIEGGRVTVSPPSEGLSGSDRDPGSCGTNPGDTPCLP
jgi:hypothetical protein